MQIVKRHLDRCCWEPFIHISRWTDITLLECARPGAVQAMVESIETWGCEGNRAVFLMAIRGLRPAVEVVSPDLLWLLPDSEPTLLNSLMPLLTLPDTLSVYPPWPRRAASGQKPLGSEDSLLVVQSTGVQVALSQLRSAAGAVCVAAPDEQVSLRFSPAWTNVFEISERGAEALHAFGPILPSLGNVKTFDDFALVRFRALLPSRATPERDRRFRIALEWLSAAWVQSGTPEFMGYFIALDALFGQGKGGWGGKGAVAAAAARLEGPDAVQKIRLIVRIRHELLHGQCPSVERSQCFLPYYRQFHRHPTEDLLYVVRQCFREEPAFCP